MLNSFSLIVPPQYPLFKNTNLKSSLQCEIPGSSLSKHVQLFSLLFCFKPGWQTCNCNGLGKESCTTRPATVLACTLNLLCTFPKRCRLLILGELPWIRNRFEVVPSFTVRSLLSVMVKLTIPNTELFFSSISSTEALNTSLGETSHSLSLSFIFTGSVEICSLALISGSWYSITLCHWRDSLFIRGCPAWRHPWRVDA